MKDGGESVKLRTILCTDSQHPPGIGGFPSEKLKHNKEGGGISILKI